MSLRGPPGNQSLDTALFGYMSRHNNYIEEANTVATKKTQSRQSRQAKEEMFVATGKLCHDKIRELEGI